MDISKKGVREDYTTDVGNKQEYKYNGKVTQIGISQVLSGSFLKALRKLHISSFCGTLPVLSPFLTTLYTFERR